MSISSVHPQASIPPTRDRAMTTQTRRRQFSRVLYYSIVGVLLIIYLIPIWWTISTSLRTNVNLFASDQWIPHPLTFEHYGNLFEFLPDFWSFVYNTVLIAVLGTAGQLVSCSMAGYALARLRFPGRSLLLFLFLLTLMIPGQATLIPTYVLFKNLDWLNTPLPMIVPAFLGNAFATFFFRQFFMTLPRDLEDAARIDGANRFRIYWNIIIPISKPAFMALGLLTFVTYWNSFFLNTIYLQTRDQWVITQALQSLIGQYNSQYGEIMAGVILMSLPIIIIYIILQRYIVESIAMSGIKG